MTRGLSHLICGDSEITKKCLHGQQRCHRRCWAGTAAALPHPKVLLMLMSLHVVNGVVSEISHQKLFQPGNQLLRRHLAAEAEAAAEEAAEERRRVFHIVATRVSCQYSPLPSGLISALSLFHFLLRPVPLLPELTLHGPESVRLFLRLRSAASRCRGSTQPTLKRATVGKGGVIMSEPVKAPGLHGVLGADWRSERILRKA